MAATKLLLAFGQLPEEVQSAFAGLFPEIVYETPTQIEVNPEKHVVIFSVGAQEFEFTPQNENYSVFLAASYRMLFKAKASMTYDTQTADPLLEGQQAEAAPAAAPVATQAATVTTTQAPEMAPKMSSIQPKVERIPEKRVAHSQLTLVDALMSGHSANSTREQTAEGEMIIASAMAPQSVASEGGQAAHKAFSEAFESQHNRPSTAAVESSIKFDLNSGLTPGQVHSKAAAAHFYGTDATHFAGLLAKYAGVLGHLTITPNFKDASCVKTNAFLNGPKKASRGKLPFYSVTKISSCASCASHKVAIVSEGGYEYCSLYNKPLVSTREDLVKVTGEVVKRNLSLYEGSPTIPHKASAQQLQAFGLQSISRIAGATGLPENLKIARPAAEEAVRMTDTRTAAKPLPFDLGAVIKRALNLGRTPDQVMRTAESRGFYGFDRETVKRAVAKYSRILGILTQEPDFHQASCHQTKKYMDQLKAKTAGRNEAIGPNFGKSAAVVRREACADCSEYRGPGQKVAATSAPEDNPFCSLYKKPIVSTIDEAVKAASKIKSASVVRVAAEREKEASRPTSTMQLEHSHEASNLNQSLKDSMNTGKTAAQIKSGVDAHIKRSFNLGFTPQQIMKIAENKNYFGSERSEVLASVKKFASVLGMGAMQPDFHQGSCFTTKSFIDTFKAKKAVHKEQSGPYLMKSLSVVRTAACPECPHHADASDNKAEFCSLYRKPVVATSADVKNLVTASNKTAEFELWMKADDPQALSALTGWGYNSSPTVPGLIPEGFSVDEFAQAANDVDVDYDMDVTPTTDFDVPEENLFAEEEVPLSSEVSLESTTPDIL